ncbi:hypothetical protein RI129_003504 [Pyrocoelia pectoralis]|uniref:Uncharacterized protein n=1 Tax=Pyrocoelia pectoralis TaxID=417401 RepID=A0AAN7VI46_9COLE
MKIFVPFNPPLPYSSLTSSSPFHLSTFATINIPFPFVYSQPLRSLSLPVAPLLLLKYCKKEMEAPGIDPGTSRMLSERSTI